MKRRTSPNLPAEVSTPRPALRAYGARATKAALLGVALGMVFMGSPGALSAAGPAPVNLLSTANFVILSGAAITATGGGAITGNVGASPITGSAIGVTCDQVAGIIYEVDDSGPECAVVDPTLLGAAKADLTTAYNDAAGRTPVPAGTNLNPGLIPGSGNIGGMNLGPGLYKFTVTALISGSDVTLTGGPDDVWIFQCAQDLQLASGIHILLAGGAQARNVFWQVGTSAILGTYSGFNGTILAGQSVSMGTGSTLTGRALASAAGIVFNGTGASLPPAAVFNFQVQQPAGTTLTSGTGASSFGTNLAGTATNLTFIITNVGGTAITGLGVTLAGVDSALFAVVTNPASTLASNGRTTFTVQFTPLSAGVKVATAQITSADTAAAPFQINLTGAGAGGAIAASTNVFAIAVSPVTLNPQTGLFEETILLTNRSASTISATRLLVQLLPSDARVYYASGSTNGYPYVQWNFPLAAGGSVAFTIEYYRSSRQPIVQPEFVPQETAAVVFNATGNPMPINGVVQTGGRFLIEFTTVPGKSYAVQYSSNLTNWTSILPLITAPANRVQWYDDGPPETQSKPGTVGSRFYRVLPQP